MTIARAQRFKPKVEQLKLTSGSGSKGVRICAAGNLLADSWVGINRALKFLLQVFTIGLLLINNPTYNSP